MPVIGVVGLDFRNVFLINNEFCKEWHADKGTWRDRFKGLPTRFE